MDERASTEAMAVGLYEGQGTVLDGADSLGREESLEGSAPGEVPSTEPGVCVRVDVRTAEKHKVDCGVA